MPHFLIQLSPRGPLIEVAVMVSAARQVALEQAGIIVPPLQRILGLIDTGASITAIERTVLEALQLNPTGEMGILTPSTGAVPAPAATYDVVIGIFAGRPNDTHFVSDTLQVTSNDFSNFGFQALIGRDILSRCIFHYNGADGVFTLAY